MKIQKNCYYLIEINLKDLMYKFETNKESEKKKFDPSHSF
jgi:hypothetical protein